MVNVEKVMIKDKYALTVPEACEYFNIGDKKLRQLINENINADFLLCNGSKYLIKRKKFEQFIDDAYSI